MLLAGAEEATLPEWWTPYAEPSSETPTDLAMRPKEIAARVRVMFRGAHWPSAFVTVLFDTSDRVECFGGYAYFK